MKLLVRKEQGMASFIVVFIIVILVSLVSLGFARLMDRALKDVSNNQLGAAADYAAQSGLNDAISVVKANPSIASASCEDLFDKSGDPLFGKEDITADELTKYSCVLVNPLPANLAYQNLPPYKSQVVKLASSNPSPITKLMFSWHSSESSLAKTPVPSGTDFQTENEWGNVRNHPPALRVTLYPISGNAIPSTANIRTYYLYPNSGGALFDPVGSVNFSEPSGTIVNGNCNAKNTNVLFVGTADYQCNVVVLGLAGADFYEVRMTPLYMNTDVGIKANDAAGEVKFRDAQSVIDVTGKSNDAVKRIQARVALGDPSDILSGDNIPEDAIRSANALCKRLYLRDDIPDHVLVDRQSVQNQPICGFLDYPAPEVTLNANPTQVLRTGSSTLSWTIDDNGIPLDADDCVASGDWSGFKNQTGGSQGTGPLNELRTYTFVLTCTSEITGESASDDATVLVNPRPPVCAPASQEVIVGSPASFTATEGDLVNYSWSAPGGTPDGRGPGPNSFSTSYGAPGDYNVTTMSAGLNSNNCAVKVRPPPPDVTLTVSSLCGGGIDFYCDQWPQCSLEDRGPAWDDYRGDWRCRGLRHQCFLGGDTNRCQYECFFDEFPFGWHACPVGTPGGEWFGRQTGHFGPCLDAVQGYNHRYTICSANWSVSGNTGYDPIVCFLRSNGQAFAGPFGGRSGGYGYIGWVNILPQLTARCVDTPPDIPGREGRDCVQPNSPFDGYVDGFHPIEIGQNKNTYCPI